MEIIDQLIEELTDKNAKLVDTLIKAKVLAFKLKNQPLKDWLEHEINGYGTAPLREYRVTSCQITGTISDGFTTAKNYPVPLGGFGEKLRKIMTTWNVDISISALEKFTVEDNRTVGKVIPPELYSDLSLSLGNGYAVIYARQEVSVTQIVQILTSIRSKLLDFLLQLNEEVGEVEDVKAFVQGPAQDKVNSLFNSTVFGDNTTIIVGDRNTQTVHNITVTKGNLQSLERLFSEHGISVEDIAVLKSVIDKDNPKPDKKEFGDKVKAWMKTMMGKAVDSSWKISLGVAGKLLADAIGQYYGWPN